MDFNKNTESSNNLAAEWNTKGHQYISKLNELIAKSYEGQDAPEYFPEEPRTVEEAKLAISLVEAEWREGRWSAEKPIVDRAHEPFVDMLDDVCQSLNCVTILGADEFLVRLGTSYKPDPTLHVQGAQVTERPDILAVTISRNRELLLLVQEQGFNVVRSLDEDPIVCIPWPKGMAAKALDVIHISNDGKSIAFVADEESVWLGQINGTDSVWTCVHPASSILREFEEEFDDLDDEEAGAWYDSMMHCDLSPDGKFIAYGSQSYGHFIDRIDGVGEIRSWAEIGHLSEYPHYACFSDDSTLVALNSCHFYNGATVCARLADIEGLHTNPYEEDRHAPLIDNRLRVYAATWLPSKEEQKEGFALAGASYLDIVSSDGTLLSSSYFGSSASSIDYCPKTGLLAVASYSGFLHIFVPSQTAEKEKAVGYRPILEQYRWVFWHDRPPFCW